MWTRCRTRAFSWLQHGLKPVIFLINNVSYTIERAILGKTARYNDVAQLGLRAAAAGVPPGHHGQVLHRLDSRGTQGGARRAARRHDLLESIMVPFDAPDLVLAKRSKT
jgi:indolepyruvate decarboxylase